MRSTVLHLAKIAGISGAETHLLSLLPRLRERDWDVRLLQLHENEPGAFEFADELRARGVPVDMIRLRADVDPIAFARVLAYLARTRPLMLHTHLVHADVYGQVAGAAARVPFRVSTKHGFNEFRENPGFALADRAVAGLAHARRDVPGLTLDIAGRGPLEPALKALAKELEIDDAVRFLGFVSPISTA